MDTTHNASSTNSILINTLKCCLTYLFNCLSGTRCHKQFSSVILSLFLSPVLKLFVQLGFHWTLIRLAVSSSEVTTVIWRYRNAIIIIIIMLFTDFLTISSRITVLPNTFTRYVYKIVGTAQLYVPSVQPVPANRVRAVVFLRTAAAATPGVWWPLSAASFSRRYPSDAINNAIAPHWYAVKTETGDPAEQAVD